jgi:acyl-CoA reductase-like NAD-dependent aldehyde dehydrogenase
MLTSFPVFLAGEWVETPAELPVTSPYDGRTVARTWLAGDTELERAADAAVAAAPVMRDLPAYKRAEILFAVSSRLAAERESIARTIAQEAGKPLRDARIETDRATMTFQVAGEEAKRLPGSGEVLPFDLAPHGVGRLAVTRRVPVGPVAAISPWNFPLNLAAHKLAPAIAAGNPIVLKPATKTPLSALTLARCLSDAGLPAGGLSVLPMPRPLGDRLVTDERFKLLTFTGSPPVGWSMKQRAGRKRVVLELGGNAGVIVDETADVSHAVQRVVAGGFTLAGQSCIAVQRVYVQRRIFDHFTSELLQRLHALKHGDPEDAETELGPMIERGELDRIDAWIAEAVQLGARVLTGGTRLTDVIYAPTVLTGVPPAAKVCAQEAFAPLVVVEPYDELEHALTALNDSAFGLQAGVFTTRIDRALRAFDVIEAGGVLVNDVPTYRIDHMPYGGVKDSGLGREGPRYTIEEMTELRLLVVKTVTSDE